MLKKVFIQSSIGLGSAGMRLLGGPTAAALSAPEMFEFLLAPLITVDQPVLTPVIRTTDRYSSVPASGEVFTGSLGWRFTLQRQATITGLGFADIGANGLGNPHTVSVHRVAGDELLASVVVPTGTQTELMGGYRFADLPSPVTLDPDEYIVWSSNFTGTDRYVRLQTVRDAANGAITFGSRYWSTGSVIPTSAPDSALYFPVSIRLWTGKSLSLTGKIFAALGNAQEIAIYRKVGSSLTKMGVATVSQLSWQYSEATEQPIGPQVLRVVIQAVGGTMPSTNDAYADVVCTVD